MKKVLLVSSLLLIVLTPKGIGQSMGESAIKEILTRSFNKQFPKVLGNGNLMDGLNLAKLKIRPGHVRIKGKTKWKLKLGKANKPIKFKGNISTRFKSFGKPDLRVNLPGDRFLFFPKYQNLNELVNLKQLMTDKNKS